MNFLRLLRCRLFTLLAATLVSISMTAAEEFIVVIDAGHGGKDPGAQSANRKVNEKDIALSVALRTGELIHKRHPEVTVKYTRRTDVYVTLNGRAQIANKAKADLFISIHCNAAENRSAYGAEVFVLGSEAHRTNANLNAAKRENSVILLEKDYKETYQGFDPNSVESYIIFEYLQGEYLKESIELAQDVQKELCSTAGRYDRGVHQAGFLVLYATTMPSILVELGFISNANELKMMNSAAGKEKLSNSIANGFDTYYKKLMSKKESASAAKAQEEKPAMPETKTQPELVPVSDEKKTPEEPTNTLTADKDTIPDIKKAQLEANPVAETPQKTHELVFKIQFLLVEAPLPVGSSKLQGLPKVSYFVENGTYKYTCGDNTNLDELLELKKKVAKTYSDAFVIAFKNGVKVNTADAIKEYRARQ